MIKNDFNIREFLTKLDHKNRAQKFTLFICGTLIYSIAFSIFFSPKNIVTGGTTGIALIVYNTLKVDISITIFILSFVLLIIGFFLLDKEVMYKTIFGVLILPIFMEFGSLYGYMLELQETSLFLMVFCGGIMMGVGNGLIIRSGFSVGGFQTLYQILYKYFGISIGKANMILNGILITISSYYFGLTNALYAIIGLYVSSVITDRIMLETSATKTFYIVTDKEQEISQYIKEELNCGVTQINAKGGYTNENKKVLMCAVPTRQYYQMKEVLQGIDNNVFFLITDTYEIYSN